MMPRERILSTLEHRQPDRVAIDFGAHRSSGISAIAYAKLKKHLGIESGDVYVYDMVQQLAVIEPEVLDRFEVDTVEMGRGFLTDPDDWKPWRLPDGTPCKIPGYQKMEDDGGDWYLLAEDGTRSGCPAEGMSVFRAVLLAVGGESDLRGRSGRVARGVGSVGLDGCGGAGFAPRYE